MFLLKVQITFTNIVSCKNLEHIQLCMVSALESDLHLVPRTLLPELTLSNLELLG